MTEGGIREHLPRFQNPGFRVARVVSVAREAVDGKLPPLMEDTRANYLGRITGTEEDIYVKAVASPWAGDHGIHFLVIPDRKDHLNIPGIADFRPEALGQSLGLAESIASHMLQQEGIIEVDFGINHSRAEWKRVAKSPLASIPQNLHIHVTGYTLEDMKPVSVQEVMESSELTGRTEEALFALGEGLFFGEIIPELQENFPAFDAIFSEIRDQRGRKRLQMNDGRSGFQHPDFPKILQAIDALAKQKYDELAKCFFEFDSKTNQFITKQDESARYKLLPRTNRIANIDQYITRHQGLAVGVKLGLQFLAAIAKDERVVMDRELGILANQKGSVLTEAEKETQMKNIANRFWAYKDLVYSMVWSARKDDIGEITWIYGFDPKVFTIHGPHQSSAYTNKIVERDLSGYFTPEQLQRIQERETAVLIEAKK